MKKIMRYLIASLATLVLVLSSMPTLSIYAAESKTHTVKVRVGNIAEFKEDTPTYKTFEVTDGDKTPYSVAIATNEITFKAEYAGNYAVNAIAPLTKSNGNDVEITDPITKNTEFVIDYIRLVDPVEYTILHIDRDSREQIATPTIAYGNAGTEIEVAPATIPGYTALTSAGKLALDKEHPENNTYTFEYAAGGSGTVTETITTTTDGGVVTVDGGTQITYVDGAPVGAAVVGGGGAGGAATGGAGNGGAVEEAPAEGGEEPVVIADDNVPLGNGEDISDEGFTISDEEVPLGNLKDNNNMVWIAAGAFIVVLLAATATIIYKKKRAITKEG